MTRNKNKKQQPNPQVPNPQVSNPQQAKNWQWWVEKVIVPILLAMIPGYFLLLSTGVIDNPFKRQATPTVTPTMLINGSDMPDLADISTSPISTQTITPTNIVTPTYTPTSTSLSSTILFEDAFIDDRNNWFTTSGYPYIGAGKYNFSVGCPASYDSFFCGTYVNIPFEFPKDFHIEVDLKILQPSDDAQIALGFQVRRNDKNLYYINYFITDGYYSLRSAYNTKDMEIIPKTSTSLMNAASDSVNRLGIEVRGTKFTPIINGNRLSEGEDGNLPDSGQTFLVIYISRGSSATVQFDNLIVQEVK